MPVCVLLNFEENSQCVTLLSTAKRQGGRTDVQVPITPNPASACSTCAGKLWSRPEADGGPAGMLRGDARPSPRVYKRQRVQQRPFLRLFCLFVRVQQRRWHQQLPRGVCQRNER